jgi:hypothetical protein
MKTISIVVGASPGRSVVIHIRLATRPGDCTHASSS